MTAFRSTSRRAPWRPHDSEALAGREARRYDSGVTPRGGVRVALGAALCCGACDEPPSRPPEAVVAAILDAHLGEYRDRLDDLAVELWRDGADEPTVILADRRGRVRVQHDDGRTEVVDGARAFGWAEGRASEVLSPDRVAAVTSLGTLAKAVFLSPLKRGGAERVDAGRIRLAGDWTLEHDGDRPLRLTSPLHGSVRFVALGAGAPALPRVVEFGELGRRRVRVLGAKVTFDDATFTPPDGAREDRPKIELGPARGPSVPHVETLGPCSWLLAPDPGGWAERVALCTARGGALGRSGRRNAGDPVLVDEGDRRWIAIPFRTPDGAAEFVPEPDEVVRDVEGGLAVVVYAPSGEYDARIEAGSAQILEFARSRGHEVRGPMRIVVNLLHEPGLVEGSVVEREMELRLEQPVDR